MKVKLPAWLEEMKEGPHKWDTIRHYKKQVKKKGKRERRSR